MDDADRIVPTHACHHAGISQVQALNRHALHVPRIPRFKIGVIAELLRQLQYAPEDIRRKQMDAAERLLAEIDPQRNYPVDFIVYRVTGYRPDSRGEPVTLVGEALVGDLVNLVQELSRGLALHADSSGRRAVAVEQVAQRLNISVRSLHRYRRLGLLCHYVTFDDGSQKLACFEDALERFVERHESRLARASAFSRIDDQTEAEILDAALALHRDEGLTINEVAERLARRFDRGQDTIRVLIRRRDRRSASPIFDDSPPLREREISMIWRAWRFGIGVGAMSTRFRKSRPTIHRAINRYRGELLRSLHLSWIDLPAARSAAEGRAVLAPPVVKTGLHQCIDDVDAMTMLASLQTVAEMNPADERSALWAFSELKRRAAGTIASLSDWPTAGPLDQIETDLRWAAMIKRRIVEAHLPGAIGFVARSLGRPLLQHRSAMIVEIIDLVTQCISRAVEAVDASRSQTVSRLARLAIEKGLADIPRDERSSRAGRMHQPSELRLRRPLSRLCTWQPWLSLRSDLVPGVASLGGLQRELMTMRYGLDGTPPLTNMAIASRVGRTETATARLVADAERALLAMARHGALTMAQAPSHSFK